MPLVEFSDFECPFCARVAPTLHQVQEKYGDQVRIVFRQTPSSRHANAQKAAEASLCAREQGKFWEMHDLLFAEQKALAADELKAKAGRLGLDLQRFSQCLDSGQTREMVQEDLKAAVVAGVAGTPTLFINGERFAEEPTLESLSRAIDAALRIGSEVRAEL